MGPPESLTTPSELTQTFVAGISDADGPTGERFGLPQETKRSVKRTPLVGLEMLKVVSLPDESANLRGREDSRLPEGGARSSGRLARFGFDATPEIVSAKDPGAPTVNA
jgi:hypothetical protein